MKNLINEFVKLYVEYGYNKANDFLNKNGRIEILSSIKEINNVWLNSIVKYFESKK